MKESSGVEVTKTKSIDRSLKESTKAIDRLKESLGEQADKMPKQTLAVEDRLAAIHGEMNSISDRMLAYKLQRIADSKMLQAVSAYAKSAAKRPLNEAAKNAQPKSKNVQTSAKKIGKKITLTPFDEGFIQYGSSTFQCKTDLDMCISTSENALDKALCYALFIRCAIKG